MGRLCAKSVLACCAHASQLSADGVSWVCLVGAGAVDDQMGVEVHVLDGGCCLGSGAVREDDSGCNTDGDSGGDECD